MQSVGKPETCNGDGEIIRRLKAIQAPQGKSRERCCRYPSPGEDLARSHSLFILLHLILSILLFSEFAVINHEKEGNGWSQGALNN